eukprot:gene31061-7155_t
MRTGNTTLEKVNLTRCGISDKGAAALLNGLCDYPGNLTHLNLGGCELGPEASKAAFKLWSTHPVLEHISFTGCAIGAIAGTADENPSTALAQLMFGTDAPIGAIAWKTGDENRPLLPLPTSTALAQLMLERLG